LVNSGLNRALHICLVVEIEFSVGTTCTCCC